MAGPSTGMNETDVQFMPSFPPSLGPFASSSAVPIAPYPTTSTSYHPYPRPPSRAPSRLPSTLSLPAGFYSLPSSRASSPQLLNIPPPRIRARTSHAGSHVPSEYGSIPPSPSLSSAIFPEVWSAGRQDRFEQRLIRLTASAGWSLSWVDNPEFHYLVDEFVNPAASIPTRSSLGGRILKRALEQSRITRDERIAQEPCRNGTIQFDGWTGMNSRHYNAFMVAIGDQVRLLLIDRVSACANPQ